MLGASLLFVVLCFLGPLGLLDGAVMFVLLVLFLLHSVRRTVSEPEDELAVAEELERVLGLPTQKRMITLFLVLGAVGLPLGAELLVDAAAAVARAAGVSNAVIGLTLVALGTSLPELATTVVAAIHRHSDVLVGNVLGSNLFNLLAIMGLTAAVAPAPIAVPQAFLRFDLLVMLGAALALCGFAWSQRPIRRTAGALFVALYALYVIAVFRLPLGSESEAPSIAQELQHGVVEALSGFGHHQVRGVRDGDEMRVAQRRSELAMELRRGELVLLPADDQGGVRELVQPIQGVVREAGVALAHEQVVGDRRAVSQVELHHRLDQVGLLERVVSERPQQPLPHQHLERKAAAHHLAPLLQQQAPLGVGPRVGPHQDETVHPLRVP
jgi:hypothetical protein